MNTILQELNITDKAEEVRILKEIITHTFTWGDMNPIYTDLSSALGNIRCPIHYWENTHSPHAKAYWDEDKEIMIVHCFREHKNYTTYDYLVKRLIEEQKLYKDPWDFLIYELGEQQTKELATLAKNKVQITEESLYDKKIEYIKNVYNKYDNVVDFINSLYTERD